MELTKVLQKEYEDSWQDCQYDESYVSDIRQAAEQMLLNKSRYQKVSGITGVPWYVIAVIHSMESDCDFKTHLHNGDPLSHRTFHEPKGRPTRGTPPFSWEDSAVDSLEFDRALGIKFWNLETLFWFLEGFNGWGYREGEGRNTIPPCRSPYIYSGTTYYKSGKYIADGFFDRNAISKQVGCLALLKELDLRGEIDVSPNHILPDAVGSVAAWQHLLNGCGYYPALEISGQMDSPTINTTKKFQLDLGLSPSGEVDNNTWQAAYEHRKLSSWTYTVPPVIKKTSQPPQPANNSITKRLYDYYSKLDNYQEVYEEVIDERGTTSYGCVAFLTTALEQSGYEIPDILDERGHSTRLWTESLSNQLIRMDWERSEEADALMPGDIVFTIATGTGEEECVPDHVYMFAGWDDEEHTNAWVIDNQKFLHIRNIYSYGDYQFTPFWYFLRA
jgi:lysozyme family protein